MVSIGPNTQSHNFTHMFNFVDLNECPKEKKYCFLSLMDIIDKNPNFKIFKTIVKNAHMEDRLNDLQANCTLFIPADKYLKNMDEKMFSNIDRGTARKIVLSSMIKNKIPSELIEDSPAAYFCTCYSPNRLFISNISGKTYIDNHIQVIQKDIRGKNGFIHVIDKFICTNLTPELY